MVQHIVNSQMRLFLLSQLRQMVSELDMSDRQEATHRLEKRLVEYKSWIGRCDRIIMVESDEELRHLSESLFESHFQTESTTHLDSAIRRAGKGDINLLFMHSDLDPMGTQRVLGSIKEHVPQLDVVFIAPPQLQSALAALHAGASLYLPRVPENPDLILPRLRRLLGRHRERRLMDNLLLELFQELTRLHGHPGDHKLLERFSWLMGVMPGRFLPTEESLEDPGVRESVDFLDDVLSDMLGPEDADQAAEDNAGGAERRIFPRLEESRIVRFSPKAAPSKTLAYLGNVSEGGLFIRTGRVLTPGTLTELDMSLINEGEEHKLACKGRVVWVDKDGRGDAKEPGIGIKFMLPSDEMVGLLRQIIQSRMGT